MSKTNNGTTKIQRTRLHIPRTNYTDRMQQFITRTNVPLEQKDGSTGDEDNERAREGGETKMCIMPTITNASKTKKKNVTFDFTKSKAENNKGHVTNEDITAMKRWFLEHWKMTKVIPYEIMTLETFLIAYFNYTYEEMIDMTAKKYRLLELKYATFLGFVSEIIGTQIFSYEHLSKFMSMCKRNFNKQKMYNQIIKNVISEDLITDAGYLINADLYAKLRDKKYKNLSVANSKTRLHTLTSWLLRGNFVYIPIEIHEKLQLDSNFDLFDREEELNTYQTGYHQFLYTDIKNSPIGINGHDKLGWFSALNNLFKTTQIIVYAPQIKNFEHQPHLATISCISNGIQTSVEVYILVSWSFYNTHKNDSGLLNISVTEDSLIINSTEIVNENDDKPYSTFMKDIMISFLKLTGNELSGTPDRIDIQIRRTVQKMGSFMMKMNAARNTYLNQKHSGIYKVAAVAGKASGKTTLINLVKNQLDNDVYIEDSDDYGKFITYLFMKKGSGDLVALENTLTETEVLNIAIEFVNELELGNLDHLPSYYNTVVQSLIREDVDQIKFADMPAVQQQLTYSKAVNTLYQKYYLKIKDLYYKLDSGKVINQKLYENGILHFMHENEINTLLEFFHIFACNYRRKPPNLAIRYQPNFDTNVAIYQRIQADQSTLCEAISDVLLKMFYDQSAEYVTSIIGPSAFLSVFGLLPVLDYTDTIEFKFSTHADVSG